MVRSDCFPVLVSVLFKLVPGIVGELLIFLRFHPVVYSSKTFLKRVRQLPVFSAFLLFPLKVCFPATNWYSSELVCASSNFIGIPILALEKYARSIHTKFYIHVLRKTLQTGSSIYPSWTSGVVIPAFFRRTRASRLFYWFRQPRPAQ